MPLPNLDAHEFANFFQTLDAERTSRAGRRPFPWQERLLLHLAAGRAWPDVLDLPTSAGKTATLEIAVFHLALQVEMPARLARRRIFFVVDRRLVVDEAYERACSMVRALAQIQPGNPSVLGRVADRLRALGGLRPLDAAMMRGGILRDPSWVSSPCQPLICATTVDQIGSRMLFRGYGVSQRRCPIDAAMTACDSLILLDEAHLSTAFSQTLEALRVYSGDGWSEESLAACPPPTVVRLSATPTLSAGEIFSLDANDRKDPILHARLNAAKHTRLIELAPAHHEPSAQARLRMANEIAKQALDLAKPAVAELARQQRRPKNVPKRLPTCSPAHVIGVVVNRVASARAIYERLAKENCGKVLLLTGRARPFDRDELLFREMVPSDLVEPEPSAGSRCWFDFIRADNERPRLNRTLWIVATQTVEVGADISFDALVTEAAPLDCLRQRCGRVDRLGIRGHSHVVIVGHKACAKDDPIYGAAVSDTWNWLAKQSGAGRTLDFGIAALQPILDLLTPTDLAKLSTVTSPAPVLLPAHLDHFCQTLPPPQPPIDISLFLHGLHSAPAEVNVVWRADLNQENKGNWLEFVRPVPPTSAEALALPVWEVRQWLQPTPNFGSELGDVEGSAMAPAPSQDRTRNRVALLWRGVDSEECTADKISPGATIVVPADYGGCDAFGWAPASSAHVRDIAEMCALRVRGRAVLRVNAAMRAHWERFDRSIADLIFRLSVLARDPDAQHAAAIPVLLRSTADLPPWARIAFSTGGESRLQRIVAAGPEGIHAAPSILVCRKRHYLEPGPALWRVVESDSAIRDAAAAERLALEADGTDEGDASSASGSGAVVQLECHARHVADQCAEYIQSLGPPEHLGNCLTLAALYHDLGKADPRFQVMLYGGDEPAACAGALLAKSGIDPYDRGAWRSAWRASGLPKGFRHECVSSHLIDRCLPGDFAERGLLRYLVGSHHGFGRSLMPPVPDTIAPDFAVQGIDGRQFQSSSDHRLYRFDSGWPELFWSLVRRFGPWRLAWIESILRFADCAVSAAEQLKGDSHGHG